MPFGLWIQVARRKHVFTVTWGGALVSHGRYNWTIHVQRRCGLMSNYFDHLLSHRMVVCGVFSLLYFCLVFVCLYGYGFLSGGKRWAWNFACMFDYYLDKCSPILESWWWWWHYLRDELYRNRSGVVRIGRHGLVGIWNWRQQRSIRPYGGIYVLQACWHTCLLFLIYLYMTYHRYSSLGKVPISMSCFFDHLASFGYVSVPSRSRRNRVERNN